MKWRKKICSLLTTVLMILFSLSCRMNVPDRIFHWTEKGLSDDTIEYVLLPHGYDFDADFSQPIGILQFKNGKDTVLNALDPEARIVQPQKYWYQDMDWSQFYRSDVELPEILDESSEIVFYGAHRKYTTSKLRLSDQACAEFRAFYQMQEDLVPESLQSAIRPETKSIATIWFLYPQIEGLRYEAQIDMYCYDSDLYMIGSRCSRKHTSAEIPHDTALYQEIVKWLSQE